MGPSTRNRSYPELVQACRAFRPSELVPAIARVSAALGEPPYSDELKRKVPPWGLATIARESLLYGNEHRRATVSDAAVTRLLSLLFNAEAMPDMVSGDKGFALALLTPILYEQFPWQESIFEELARSHALLIEGLEAIDTEILSEESIADVLGGISLREAIGATFVLQVGAYQNGGSYNTG